MATELKNFKATGISTLTIEDFLERTKPLDAEKKPKFWKKYGLPVLSMLNGLMKLERR